MALPDQLNPALRNLPVYKPGRPLREAAMEIGTSPEHLVKLASNENPLGPSIRAVKAMKQSAAEMHRYPDGNAFHLRQCLSEKLNVQSDNLVFGNGSNEILEFVAHALLKPGDDVVVSQYCFAMYPIIAKMMGAKVIEVPAKEHGHDLSAMLKAITPKTRIVFVANPNNPTGTIAQDRDVEQMIAGLPPNVLLVMDQAYFEYREESRVRHWPPRIHRGIGKGAPALQPQRHGASRRRSRN
jgi:histidinol-phosphate aminotransferase